MSNGQVMSDARLHNYHRARPHQGIGNDSPTQQQSRPLLRCRTIKSGELFGLAASSTSPGGLPEKVTRWLTPHLTKGRTCQNLEQRCRRQGGGHE